MKRISSIGLGVFATLVSSNVGFAAYDEARNNGNLAVPLAFYNPVSEPAKLTIQQKSQIAIILKDFDDMRYNDDPHSDVAKISTELNDADLDYQDLDLTGTKTRSQMVVALKQRYIDTDVENARRLFKELTKSLNPRGDVKNIQSDLQDAKLTLAALDPTGKSTAPEIQKELDNRLQIGMKFELNDNIKFARDLFAELSTSPDANGNANLIGSSLSEVGVTYAALDPAGKHTGAQMRAVVEQRRKTGVAYWNAAHINNARIHFNDLAKPTKPDDAKLYDYIIEDNLKSAGASYAVLDPAGKSTDAQMRAKVASRVQMATHNAPHVN